MKRKSASIEASLLEIAKKQCLKHGLEIRTWQAGTTSDFGVRPLSEKSDRWLPMQAKTTLASRQPFKFFFKHQYDMDVVGIPGNRMGAYHFSEVFMKKHWDKLVGGKYVSVTPGQVWNRPMLRWPQFAQHMLDQWIARPLDLKTEMELRMQCTPNSQREICTQMLMIRMFPKHRYEWPSNAQDVYDRIRDGAKVQDKVVQTVATKYVVKMSKKVASKQVAYEPGDADLFVCCTVHAQLRLLIVWEFTNDELLQKGILKSGTDAGKTSIPLSLGAKHRDLHTSIFGGSLVENWTGKHVQVFPLPSDFVIPECLRNRDPKCN